MLEGGQTFASTKSESAYLSVTSYLKSKHLVHTYFCDILGDSIDITTVASRKPGQPVLASSAPDPAKVFHPPVIPNMAAGFHPEAMGPQPGQTVEQWLSANHAAPVISEALPLHSSKENIPAGASMYSSYPNNDDMEAFEQQHLTLKKKRSQVPHSWTKNITTVTNMTVGQSSL